MSPIGAFSPLQYQVVSGLSDGEFSSSVEGFEGIDEINGLSVSVNVFSSALVTAAAGRALSRQPPSILSSASVDLHDSGNLERPLVVRQVAFSALARVLGQELGLGSAFACAVFHSRGYGVVGRHKGDLDPCSIGTEVTEEKLERNYSHAVLAAEKWALDAATELRTGPLAEGLDDGYAEAVAAITAAHMLELVALRSFGAGGVKSALEVASLVHFSSGSNRRKTAEAGLNEGNINITPKY